MGIIPDFYIQLSSILTQTVIMHKIMIFDGKLVLKYTERAVQKVWF